MIWKSFEIFSIRIDNFQLPFIKSILTYDLTLVMPIFSKIRNFKPESKLGSAYYELQTIDES